MKVTEGLTELIDRYSLTNLNGSESLLRIIPKFTPTDLKTPVKYPVEFLSLIPKLIIDNNLPNIFKFNGINNNRMIIILLELSDISIIKKIDFYLGNTYKFSILLENLDRKYSQIIQLSYGDDISPNLSSHINNNKPHTDLLTIGNLDKIDNINIPSSLYAESITTFNSSGIIGNTLVNSSFSKFYIGEIDEYDDV
jgi:hypothetical protein